MLVTAGQIAYERFVEAARLSRVPGGVPPFDELPAHIQAAWREVASAVTAFIAVPPTCPELEAAEPASEES